MTLGALSHGLPKDNMPKPENHNPTGVGTRLSNTAEADACNPTNPLPTSNP